LKYGEKTAIYATACITAGLGGTTYWCAIFPVDCIKSAMQTDSLIKGERKYKDVVSTAKVRGYVV
jgi:solute carrier family 25 carnitine/acylcarnitine transporter 20/29